MDLPTLSMISGGLCADFDEPIVLQRSQENYIYELPLELQGKIVKDMFNFVVHEYENSKKCVDQKKLEKYILSIPILLGIKFVDELCQWQRVCWNKIGNKQFVAQQLFVLPRQAKDVFTRLAERSSFDEYDICANDYKIITEMSNKEITKGLCLRVKNLNPVLDCVRYTSVFGFTILAIINPLILNIHIMHIKYWKKIHWFFLFGCYANLGTFLVSHYLIKPKQVQL
jgi:hypothetical protein